LSSEASTLTSSTSTEADAAFMRRAFALARRGVGLVSPGPLVGCVIVDPTGKLLGEGYYIYEEVKHAETIALEQAGKRARGGTAYVSLEPHAHHGRTPPCTDALIQAGIARVVAPIEDPNPRVSGIGFEHLRSVGIQVSIGILAREAESLNEQYLHFMRTGRPFVHLKLAVSLDGKIATRTGDSRWIAGPEARARAHELRHECDAILVGAGTMIADDPLLTDRSQEQRRRALIRVVLDEGLQLSAESQLARTAHEAPVLVFSGKAATGNNAAGLEARGVEIISDEAGGRDVIRVLNELGSRSIQRLLVEGGGGIAGAFIDAGMVNKVTFFVAPILIGGRTAPTAVAGLGVKKMADALRLKEVEITQRGSDVEITGYVTRSENEA